MRLLALDVGDEADAAGVLLQARDRSRPSACGTPCMQLSAQARRLSSPRSPTAYLPRWFRARIPTRSCVLSLSVRGLTAVGAPWTLRHPPGHRSSAASRIFLNSDDGRFNVPCRNGPACSILGAGAPSPPHEGSRCNPHAGMASKLRQPCCPNLDLAKFLSITQARGSPRPHAQDRAARRPRRPPIRSKHAVIWPKADQGPPDFSNEILPRASQQESENAPRGGADRVTAMKLFTGSVAAAVLALSAASAQAQLVGDPPGSAARRSSGSPTWTGPMPRCPRFRPPPRFGRRSEPAAAGRGLHRAARERLPAARRAPAARLRLYDLGDRPAAAMTGAW